MSLIEFYLILIFTVYTFANAYGYDVSLFTQLSRTKRQIDALQNSLPVEKPKVSNFVVTSDIKYRYAETLVSSKVENPANISQEISFSMTLPDSAFISKFFMIINDKVYEAYVLEKESAKHEYNEAKRAGRTAGHVEIIARDSNVFEMSVNIEPLTNVTFNLKYEQLLQRTLGVYDNVIHVSLTEEIPYLEIRCNIQESSKIKILEELELTKPNEIYETVQKNKHGIISRPTDKENMASIIWTCTPEDQKAIIEAGGTGQFIARYDVDHEAESNEIFLENGYFVHFYAPTDLPTMPKYIIFVLDISGSMHGKKLQQLKDGMHQILAEIDVKDYFSIILFSTDVQLWTLNGVQNELRISDSSLYDNGTKYIVPATKDNVIAATQFVDSLNARASTNIISALNHAIKLLEFGNDLYPQHEQIVFFLTDGLPNIEQSDTNTITKTITSQNRNKSPIFSLALGHDADDKFLRSLSLSNGGFSRKIYVDSDTNVQLKNFYKQISSPLLSKVTFKYVQDQVDEDSLTKPYFRNYFSGSELVFAGKIKESLKDQNMLPDVEIIHSKKSEPDFSRPRTTPRVNQTFSGRLERLWAYLHIKQLLDDDLISGQNNLTFRTKALKLALSHGFVTPLTSLVVVKPDKNEQVNLETKKPEIIRGSAWGLVSRIVGGSAFDPVGGSPPFFQSHSYSAKRGDFTYQSRSNPLIVGGSNTAIELKSGLPDNNFLLPNDMMLLKDVLWLNDTITSIKLPGSNTDYLIRTNNMDATLYQNCSTTKYGNGHCRHFEFCILPEIVDSYEDYLKYSCIISNNFAGVCCPDGKIYLQ